MNLFETFRPVMFINGLLLMVLAVSMSPPLIADLIAHNPDWQVFAASALATLMTGLFLVFSQGGAELELNIKQAFMLTTTGWILLAAFAALPLRFSNLDIGATDAFFEAMSGLTTTGSTVLAGLDAMPPGILLWRSILQWIGGIGIIVMAIAILPFLRSGGMQLFRTESSDMSERVVPRIKRMTGGLVLTYAGLTISCAAALWWAGMSPLDAIIHAMTTLSTGGFSSHDASIAYFHSALIENIVLVFMISGSIPFIAYLKFAHGDLKAFTRDPQIRGLLGILTTMTVMLTTWLVIKDGFPILDALRLSAFNIVSVISTTGFASTDYTLWGALPLGAFFLMTFIGGCTGSTSGGIKILRFQVLRMVFSGYVWRLIYPHGVRSNNYGDSSITVDVAVGVLVFTLTFVVLTGLVGLLLTSLGLDLDTAMSGAATAIANVGPGLGNIIGPTGNFEPLPDTAKWVLAFSMLLGRLEFFTVLVLFTTGYWRS